MATAITSTPVNWILDADIRSFFDSVSQEWLVRFIEHRIGDQRIIRLVRKWLKAGVLEEGELSVSETGTPQGSGMRRARCRCRRSPEDAIAYRSFLPQADAAQALGGGHVSPICEVPFRRLASRSRAWLSILTRTILVNLNVLHKAL
ncbi:hypothetical protein CS8_000220 [Cupriavidus sp. 8B]